MQSSAVTDEHKVCQLRGFSLTSRWRTIRCTPSCSRRRAVYRDFHFGTGSSASPLFHLDGERPNGITWGHVGYLQDNLRSLTIQPRTTEHPDLAPNCPFGSKVGFFSLSNSNAL